MNRPVLNPLLSSLCSLILIALPATAGADKTDISERGVPHFEAQIPPGARVALHIRAGDIRILGAEDGKLTVDISGKNKNNIEDLRYRLTSSGGNAELHVSGGPRNDLNIEVHIPRNSELYARISAAPFGEERGGIFRSFKKSGPGKFTLYAHVGAGDLTLR